MHEYVIGKSGSGKSTFLQNHILQNRGGFAVLDPHGDLAEKIADTISCIYFDPTDTEFPVGFDPLHHVPLTDRPLVAAQVLASLKAIWADSWGYRLEYILINCLRLLLDNSAPIIVLPRLLTDGHYRAALLRHCTDPTITAFWQTEFENWDYRFRSEALAPVQNKIGQLVGNPILRNILSHRTLNLSRIMDAGQRLVVNLAKGKLGEAPSHLLGALLIAGFARAAESRAAIDKRERVPFTIYADEFQNFATDGFADILSESRKYALSLVLAHQYLGQLSARAGGQSPLRDAVFGNVGRLCSFRIGAEDAPIVARELGLHNPEMLTDLAPFEVWERSGVQASFFRTAPASPSYGQLRANRATARARYARNRKIVEEKVAKYLAAT
jgi:hypothetical protein